MCIYLSVVYYIGGWGEGASNGKSFRVVRACVRAVWMPYMYIVVCITLFVSPV